EPKRPLAPRSGLCLHVAEGETDATGADAGARPVSGTGLGMPSLVLAACAVSVALAAQIPADSDLARSVAARPRDPRLHNEYGIALQRSGRTAEADAHFRTALDLDPRFTGRYVRRCE